MRLGCCSTALGSLQTAGDGNAHADDRRGYDIPLARPKGCWSAYQSVQRGLDPFSKSMSRVIGSTCSVRQGAAGLRRTLNANSADPRVRYLDNERMSRSGNCTRRCRYWSNPAGLETSAAPCRFCHSSLMVVFAIANRRKVVRYSTEQEHLCDMFYPIEDCNAVQRRASVVIHSPWSTRHF